MLSRVARKADEGTECPLLSLLKTLENNIPLRPQVTGRKKGKHKLLCTLSINCQAGAHL